MNLARSVVGSVAVTGGATTDSCLNGIQYNLRIRQRSGFRTEEAE
ncbi:MAG: hypothetical protein QGI49_05825 [SAR202 cluster bacterium]|nr:hypothetical protein [SAR202 cluster bacterium]